MRWERSGPVALCARDLPSWDRPLISVNEDGVDHRQTMQRYPSGQPRSLSARQVLFGAGSGSVLPLLEGYGGKLENDY